MSTTTSGELLEEVLTQEPEEINLFLRGMRVGEVGAMQIQKHMTQFGSVRLLDLRGSCIGRHGAESLARGLRCCPQLVHFGMSRGSLDHVAASTLIRALQSTAIETIDLEWNSLPDAVAVSIADLMRHTKTLRSVNLERNDIRSEGVVALCQALKLPTATLQNLNLAFNRCGQPACEAIGDALEVNTTLLTLNLTQCSITTDASRHILRGLFRNHTLVSINLQANQVLDAFAGRSAGGTATFPVGLHASLRELNLGGNRIASTYIPAFAQVLEEAKGLVALSLGKCLFGEPGAHHVLRSISLLTRLVTLDISGCLMTHTCGELLASMLTRCPNIASLYLDDNPLGRFGTESVASSIPMCSNLTCLSMCRVDMRKEGMLALAAALRHRVGLPIRELRLVGNDLGYDGCIALCDALVNMRGDASKFLEVLDISDNDIGGRSCAFLASVLQAHKNSLLSINLRGNPISEETKQNFLTFEAALQYTGGVISDPTLRLGQSSPTRGTFEIGKTPSTAASGGGERSSSPLTTQHRRSVTNFNGTTAAGTPPWQHDGDHHGVGDGRHRREVTALLPAAVTGTLTSTATGTPQRSPRLLPSNAMSPTAAPSPSSNATSAAVGAVYEPGFNPVVPPFKQRHALHDVGENIAQLPVTDTQLRELFTLLDASCRGYISIHAFVRAYVERDPICFEFTSRRVQERAEKLCPDGRVTYQRFCVLMLQLVNQ